LLGISSGDLRKERTIMLWFLLLIVLAIIVLPILVMAGALELVFNPMFGVVALICVTVIIITKIIRR
jgi:predicted nucleic acid-binding Zn ribbon protein